MTRKAGAFGPDEECLRAPTGWDASRITGVIKGDRLSGGALR